MKITIAWLIFVLIVVWAFWAAYDSTQPIEGGWADSVTVTAVGGCTRNDCGVTVQTTYGRQYGVSINGAAVVGMKLYRRCWTATDGVGYCHRPEKSLRPGWRKVLN